MLQLLFQNIRLVCTQLLLNKYINVSWFKPLLMLSSLIHVFLMLSVIFGYANLQQHAR